MKRIPFTRTYDLLVLDVIPRGLARMGYKGVPQPRGAARLVSEDYSMAVPFRFDTSASHRRQRVAVVCHLYYEEFAPWLLNKLRQAELRADIFISTTSVEKKTIIARVFSGWDHGAVDIRIVANRGRDIAPKMLAFSEIYDRYDYLLFLHGKKSLYFDFGEEWREYLADSLVGSSAVANSILTIFEQCPQVGFVFPQHFSKLRDQVPITWASNFLMSRRVAWRMGIDLQPEGYVDFPSGSMFWCRPAALRPLLGLNLKIDDFPPEAGRTDMTLAHCLERLFLFACEQAGYAWVKVSAPDSGSTPTAVVIERPEDIARFVREHGFCLLPPSRARA